MFTVGAVPGELLPDPSRGLRPGAARRSRRRGASACRRRWSELGVEPEAILLTHTHIDHIGAVAPIARATGVPVYCPRAELDDPRAARPVLPARRGARVEAWEAEQRARRRRAPAARGLRRRRRLDARPQPRPRHLRDRRGAVLRRRALRELDRAHRPAGRRPRDAHGLDRRRCSSASTTTRRSTPVTWGSPRSAASARRTPSCRRSRAGEREAPGAARHVRRAARRGRRAGEPRGRRAPDPRAAPATGASRRRPSRPPSSSPAAWASRPTSSRRRCTPSRTPAGAR